MIYVNNWDKNFMNFSKNLLKALGKQYETKYSIE